MDTNLVTKAQWDDVYTWAIANGYSFDYAGSGKAANHPVQSVSWLDCVKWCNARSQKEGVTPAYYTDTGLTTVYKTGQVAPYVNWSAGYRLPTEAEWEYAAQGGLSGKRFPWGDTITHSNANYYSDASYSYDVSPTRGYHPTYATNGTPYTSPVGSFTPNGYGLYDMAGNVWQWCWDWYGSYPFTAGAFDAGGYATNVIVRGKDPVLQVHLRLDLTGGEGMNGVVKQGTVWSSDLWADLALKQAVKASYTVQVGQWEGGTNGGKFTLAVQPSGAVTLSGTISNKTVLSGSLPLTAKNEVVLYQTLYGGKGMWLGYVGLGSTNRGGVAHWQELVNPADKVYPNGFSVNSRLLLP